MTASSSTGAGSPRQDATIRDIRATLTPAQGATLDTVVCHLREALAGLDALSKAIGEGIERERERRT